MKFRNLVKLVEIFLLLLLNSCQSNPDHLFWIEKNTKGSSDFLFMAESANVPHLVQDSLSFFLSPEELKAIRTTEEILESKDTIRSTVPLYKHYGELYNSDQFKLHVIFKDGKDTFGRDYQFLLRTYQYNWEIIDSYELARWNKRNEVNCFGYINKALMVEKSCPSEGRNEKYKLKENGHFERVE